MYKKQMSFHMDIHTYIHIHTYSYLYILQHYYIYKTQALIIWRRVTRLSELKTAYNES